MRIIRTAKEHQGILQNQIDSASDKSSRYRKYGVTCGAIAGGLCTIGALTSPFGTILIVPGVLLGAFVSLPMLAASFHYSSEARKTQGELVTHEKKYPELKAPPPPSTSTYNPTVNSGLSVNPNQSVNLRGDLEQGAAKKASDGSAYHIHNDL